MPDFNSPLGRRAFAAVGQQRVLTVPDEDQKALYAQPKEVLSQDEEQYATERDIEAIQASRKARVAASKKIGSGAKERIEFLTGLGRGYDVVDFEGVSFSIRSLKDKEMREVVRISNTALDATDSFFEARIQTLARSIYEIDEQPISLVLGSNKLEDIVAWVEEMDESLVEFIHDHYLDMVKKNRIKFAIKDENDAKEVAEEIKK